MSYPQALEPTGTEAFPLPSGAVVQLPKATPRFRLWQGAPISDDYGGKTVLDAGGKPAFAELLILGLFEAEGWKGVWVDTYRRRCWTDMQTSVELPAAQRALLDKVSSQAGSRNGCFDVFVWRDDEVMFAEAKRAGKDRIRKTQICWLDAALRLGLPVNAFLVVEWCEDSRI